MNTVRPDVQNLLAMLAAVPGPQMHESDPATARAMMHRMRELTELPRGNISHVVDFTIPSSQGHAIPARAYSNAEAPGPGPVLVYFHGGGWVIGDLDTHDALCAEIARALAVTVVSVGYRLAPEHPFPAASDDCLTATRWLAETPSPVGHIVTGLIPAGDSAGGTLAAVVTQQLHGQLPVPILAQWLIYPATDMTAHGGSMDDFAEGHLLTRAGMAWFSRHYLGELTDPLHPQASPQHSGLLAGSPQTLVFTCGLDPIRDQGRAYAAKLIEHGVATRFREAAGQIHGCFTLRAAIPSAQADLHGCLEDLKAMIAEAVAALPAGHQQASAS